MFPGGMASYENTTCVKLDANTFGIYTKYKYSILNDMSSILEAHHQKALEVTRNNDHQYFNYITQGQDGYFRRKGPRPIKLKGKFDILVQTYKENPDGIYHDAHRDRLSTNDQNTCD